MEELILRLPEIKFRHQPFYGSKAVNLGVISREMKTPPGFCLSASVYTMALKHAGIYKKISEMAESCHDRDLEYINEKSEEIYRLIMDVDMPREAEIALSEGYDALSDGGVNPGVAVRSSATAEDLPSASFAGQMESYLHISTLPGVIEAVKQCWASLWTPRAIHYRFQKGIGQSNIAMAVVVQVMVPAQTAGVMFTANPISNSRKEFYIEAVTGLGEGLVLGEKNADRYIVAKESLAILFRQTVEGHPYLTDHQIKTLADYGAKLEFMYGEAQDIEWAYHRGEIYLLQTRPITTLADEEPDSLDPSLMTKIQRDVWINVNERFPEPVLPMDGIIAKIYYLSLFSAYKELGFSVPYVEWGKIEEGLFPEFFRPPAIRSNPLRLFKIRKTTDWDIEKEWKENEALFNKYIKLLQDERLKDFPLEIIMEYIEDALRDFQRTLTFRYLLYIQYGTVFDFLARMLKTFYGSQGQKILEGLTAGEPQVTMDLNEKLIQLAGMAQTREDLVRVITDNEPGEIRRQMAALDGGEEFLRAFDIFLEKYGDRELSQGLGGLAAPTWREEPEVVWGMLRGILLAGTFPEERREAASGRREDAEAALKELTSRGAARVLPLGKLTEKLVDASRKYNAFRENSHFYLTQAMTVFRTLFLQLGNRLVRRGLLSHEEEIMYFNFYEVKDLLYALYSSQKISRLELADKIASRRQAQERRRKRWLNRNISLEQGAEGILQGVGASSGIASGPCRIITDPRDFSRLEPGDILVARYTNPAWTPVFSFVGGLVVEYGSTVSHAAIIAREYGIPAVMGVGGVTAILTDGEVITIDGAKGLVQR